MNLLTTLAQHGGASENTSAQVRRDPESGGREMILWRLTDRFNHAGHGRTRVKVPLRRCTYPAHGTLAGYQRGCGCQACRTANRDAQRAKRRGMSA